MSVLVYAEADVERRHIERCLAGASDIRVMLFNSTDVFCENVRIIESPMVVISMGNPAAAIELVRRLRAANPQLRALVVGDGQSASLWECVYAGANGYVLRHSLGDMLVPAVRAVSAGAAWLDQELTDVLMEALSSRLAESLPAISAAQLQRTGVSSRELQVLDLVLQGKKTAEIAECLRLSLESVTNYMHRLIEKLSMQLDY